MRLGETGFEHHVLGCGVIEVGVGDDPPISGSPGLSGRESSVPRVPTTHELAGQIAEKTETTVTADMTQVFIKHAGMK